MQIVHDTAGAGRNLIVADAIWCSTRIWLLEITRLYTNTHIGDYVVPNHGVV